MTTTASAAAPATRIPKREMSRDEWLKARGEGIGSSDMATIVGLNPYRTRYDLWLEKTGQKAPEDLSDNPAVYFGNVLEDVVAQEFARRTGRKVRRDNFIRRHPDHPWMLANLDRQIVAEDGGEPEILECKTAGFWASQGEEWGADGTDLVPERYLIQVQHQLAVTGRKRAFLAVLIAGNDFRTYEIHRNEQIIASITRIGEKFWNCVVNDEPPPAETMEDGKQKFPFAVAEKSVEADNDALALFREAVDLKTDIKDLEEKLSRVEGRLCDIIGDAEALKFGSKTLVTWKQVDTNRFAQKEHEAEHPDCHKKFMRPSTSRRFEIKTKAAA